MGRGLLYSTVENANDSRFNILLPSQHRLIHLLKHSSSFISYSVHCTVGLKNVTHSIYIPSTLIHSSSWFYFFIVEAHRFRKKIFFTKTSVEKAIICKHNLKPICCWLKRHILADVHLYLDYYTTANKGLWFYFASLVFFSSSNLHLTLKISNNTSCISAKGICPKI